MLFIIDTVVLYIKINKKIKQYNFFKKSIQKTIKKTHTVFEHKFTS